MYRGEASSGSSFFRKWPTKTRRYSGCSTLFPPHTAEIRHAQVRDDKIRRPFLHELHGLVSVRSNANAVSLAGESGLQHTRNLRLIVHHQDVALGTGPVHEELTSLPA